MNVEIRVPVLPESVADATLVAWRKQPGESVSRDENLADLETDKVVLEVPSPVAGVLQEIRAPAGSTVKNGELLAVVAAGEAPRAAPAKVAAPAAAPATGSRRSRYPESGPSPSPFRRRSSDPLGRNSVSRS
jgi:2-oxoglutarate dehydrogenase E2 component (dihydrolipoamide succinyltransferase)